MSKAKDKKKDKKRKGGKRKKKAAVAEAVKQAALLTSEEAFLAELEQDLWSSESFNEACMALDSTFRLGESAHLGCDLCEFVDACRAWLERVGTLTPESIISALPVEKSQEFSKWVLCFSQMHFELTGAVQESVQIRLDGRWPLQDEDEEA